MRVAQVWRYPVKSLQGESLAHLDVTIDGVPGDRRWAVRDSVTGAVLNARVTRQLLHAASGLDGARDRVRVTLPDGRTFDESDDHLDLALSAWLGRPVSLTKADHGEVTTIEAPAGIDDEPGPMARWRSTAGTFNDGHPVHVLTTASLRAAGRLHPAGTWEARRFRPNLLLDVDGDDFVEDGWSCLRIGDVELEVYKQTTRCVLTARSQPGLLDDLAVPRVLARNRKAKLGVYARVRAPGSVAAGDAVEAS